MTRRRADPALPDALQIVIRADGRVSFGHFTDEMLEVALRLAPHDPRLRARAAGAASNTNPKRGADEPRADRRD